MKIQIPLFALLISAFSVTAQTEWAIDKSHTDIRFTVTHMTISEVDGERSIINDPFFLYHFVFHKFQNGHFGNADLLSRQTP